MSAHSQPAVRAYLARVRTALSDLPSAEVDEIVEDVRPHLAEIAESLGDRASVAAMTEQLGSPESYAAEVRSAGEYPPPPVPEEDREPERAPRRAGARLALWGLLLGGLAAAATGAAVGFELEEAPLALLLLVVPVLAAAGWYAWSRGTEPVRALPEVRRFVRGGEGTWSRRLAAGLGALHPVWWGLCAMVLAMLGVVLVAGPGNGFLGLPLLLALAVLVLWAGPRSRTDRRMLWAVLPVSAFVVGAGVGVTGYLTESVRYGPSYYAQQYRYDSTNTAADGDPLLYYGEEQLDNLYIFDSEGKPVTDVYLYTENGRPLIVPRHRCEESSQTKVPAGEDNRFPRPHIEQGGVDEYGSVNGYNAYRPFCTQSDEVPFTVAVPKESGN